MRRIVAVGSSGSATGFCAVSSLARRAAELNLEVIACDTNARRLVAASTEVSGFRQLPYASEPGFGLAVAETLAQMGVTYFYPIHDKEIRASARDRGALEEHGITVCAPSWQSVERATDKLAMARDLRAASVSAPETFLVEEASWDELGMIAKPRRGVGSHGFCHFEDRAAFETFREARLTSDVEYVFQRALAAPEITVDVFLDPARALCRVACRERLEVKSGVSTKSRVFHSDDLLEMGEAIGRALGLVGSFCFQVRRDEQEGRWSVIDVNPRIGGATAISVAVGIDFPAAHFAMFAGLDPSPFLGTVEGEYHVVRSYREHVTCHRPA